MKKSFTLLAAVAMMFAANAQDLVIETNAHNPNVQILQNGRFNPLTSNIGNTGDQTVVCLGEVDFTEEYNAAGLLFAQGWGGKGNYAILSAGDTYETSVPFTQIALAHTYSYNNYLKLAGNMAYNAEGEGDLPGGARAREDLVYTKPEGKKKVFMSFVGGAGNIQAVHFYKNAFTADDFHSEGGWEPAHGQLLRPIEKDNYLTEVATRLDVANSVRVYPTDGDTPRIDGDNGWGWTSDGVIVNYGTMNFGNGEYTQVCGYVGHWSNTANDKIQIYLDDANNEANMIAEIFTGMELRDKFQSNLYPKAKNLTETITGEHTVYVKWVGGSSNLTHLDFCKGNVWPEMPDPDYAVLAVVNETPSENAKHYTMLNDVPEGATKLETEGLNRTQMEGNGNYGYTGNGTVIKLKNVDFENGQFNKILVTYSTGGGDWIGYVDEANMSFYIDLEKEEAAPMVKAIDWSNAHEALADVDPIAVVRHQATGGWGNRYTIGADLAPVAGVHDVYVVYYQKYSDEGANIFDYYLDQDAATGIDEINVVKTKAYKTIENGQVIIVVGDARYNLMGQPVK